MKKYHIEKNTVQETLIIPLYGRKVCSDHFPQLFRDPEAERICGMLDYDFAVNGKKMETTAGLFGALEVAQRQYDLGCEVKEYLEDHPEAAVVNLGCGLDDTFRKCENGRCLGYNIDMPDVTAIRNELLPGVYLPVKGNGYEFYLFRIHQGVHCLYLGDFRPAVRAPGRPEQKQDRLPAEIAEFHALSVYVIEREIRYGLSLCNQLCGVLWVKVFFY